MRNSTLKDFYRGSLNPAERRMIEGSEIAAAMAEMSEAESLLARSLPPDLGPALNRLTQAQIAYADLAAEAYYIDGFRTGARLMMDVLDGGDENLGPIAVPE